MLEIWCLFSVMVNFNSRIFYKDNFLLVFKVTWILYQENEIVEVPFKPKGLNLLFILKKYI